MTNNKIKNQNGYILVIIIFILIILSIIIIAYLKAGGNYFKSTQNSENMIKTRSLLNSGLEYADYLLKKGSITGDTTVIKYLYKQSSDTFGYFKINIVSDTIIVEGYYNNFIDTIIGKIGISPELNHYILTADSGIDLFNTGAIHHGIVHSNTYINSSPLIVLDSAAITSVATGQSYVPLLTVNFDSYQNYINANGKVYIGDTAFNADDTYQGLYYIKGNATIGGPMWWNQQWNYRQGIIFQKKVGAENLDYSLHHYYITINFLTDFPIPIDNIDVNSFRMFRNNTQTYKGDTLAYQLIASADMNGINGIDSVTILTLIYEDDLNNAAETEVTYYLYFDVLNNGTKTAPVFDDQAQMGGGLRVTTYDNSGGAIYRAKVDSNRSYIEEYRNYLGTNSNDLIIALILDYNPWGREDYTAGGAVTTTLTDGNLLITIRSTKTLSFSGCTVNLIKYYYFYPRYFIVDIYYRQTSGALISTAILRFFHTNELINSWIEDNFGVSAFINGSGDGETMRRAANIRWYGVYRNNNAYSMSVIKSIPANDWIEYWDAGAGGDIDHWGAIGIGRESIVLGNTYYMQLAYKNQPGQANAAFAQNDYTIFSNDLNIIFKNDGATNFSGTLVADNNVRVCGKNKNKIKNSIDTLPVILSKNKLYSTITSKTNPPDIEGLIYAKSKVYFNNIFLKGSIMSDSIITTNNINLNFFNDSSAWDNNAFQFIDIKKTGMPKKIYYLRPK